MLAFHRQWTLCNEPVLYGHCRLDQFTHSSMFWSCCGKNFDRPEWDAIHDIQHVLHSNWMYYEYICGVWCDVRFDGCIVNLKQMHLVSDVQHYVKWVMSYHYQHELNFVDWHVFCVGCCYSHAVSSQLFTTVYYYSLWATAQQHLKYTVLQKMRKLWQAVVRQAWTNFGYTASAHFQKWYACLTFFIAFFYLLYLLLNSCSENDAKHNVFSSVDCWWLWKCSAIYPKLSKLVRASQPCWNYSLS